LAWRIVNKNFIALKILLPEIFIARLRFIRMLYTATPPRKKNRAPLLPAGGRAFFL
jgi:hypothetical protein